MIPDRLQYFLGHFWNDQKCDKYGHSDPVDITKIFQTTQAKLWGIIENLIFISGSLKILFVWKVCVPDLFLFAVCLFIVVRFVFSFLLKL